MAEEEEEEEKKYIYTAHTYQYVFTMWKKCSFEIWNRGTGNGVIAEMKTSSSSSSPLFPPSLAPSFAVADSVARYEHVEGTVHSFIISFYIAALVTESAGGGCGIYMLLPVCGGEGHSSGNGSLLCECM